MPSRHFSERSRQASSPYSRYHWSVSATTHSSPERDVTCFSGSEYTMAPPSAIMMSRIFCFTSFTGSPLWTPRSMIPSVKPLR